MEAAVWPSLMTVLLLILGKLIDNWLSKSKDRREDRAGAMTENEKLWARQDAMQIKLDACQTTLAEMTAKYEGLEERHSAMVQQFTAALLELDLYRKRYGPLVEPNGGTPA
jgi:hypothetical protein